MSDNSTPLGSAANDIPPWIPGVVVSIIGIIVAATIAIIIGCCKPQFLEFCSCCPCAAPAAAPVPAPLPDPGPAPNSQDGRDGSNAEHLALSSNPQHQEHLRGNAEHLALSSNPQHQEHLRDIKDALRKLYQDVNLMTPAILNKEYEINIDEVFTELNLLKSGKEDEGAQAKSTSIKKEGRPTTSLTKVLAVIKLKDSCKVLITGKGGMGKTTLLRYIAHNWATNRDDTFAGKLLFLINIRDIKAGTNPLNVTLKQITPKYNLTNDSLERILFDHGKEIVMLLDGYDELENDANDLMNPFKGQFEESTVVITSRPENTTDLAKSCDVHVEVKGFSKESIKEYIHKQFKAWNITDLGELLIKEFNLHSEEESVWGGDHKEAFDLCSSPLLLLKICTIWKYKCCLPKCLTDLFKEVICCILNQSKVKYGNETAISKFKRIPEKNKSAILALGQCMYEGLKKNTLSIDKYVLTNIAENADVVDLALKPGFVYKDRPVAADDLREIYTPPHKLLSEALAGYYLSEQSKKDSFGDDEYEMIRSNKYLHMTRVFAIGFLGANAGKLLKHWMKNRASNYYSLAKYFKYVKKEHDVPVLKELDEHMPPEMKVQCKQMCESFTNVRFTDGDDDGIKATVSEDTLLIQLMRQCCVKYEREPVILEQMLVKTQKYAELSINDACAMLVHILIIVEGLHADNGDGDYRNQFPVIGYLGNWKDNEIDILAAKMRELEFKYNLTEFDSRGMRNFNFSDKLSPKLLIHLLETAPKLTTLKLENNCMSSDELNHICIELHESGGSWKLTCLHLNRLTRDFNGVLLANLLKITPKLKLLSMQSCKLSETIINTVVTECQSCQVVLELNYLRISFNDLSDVNGVSLANLLKIAPKLKILNMGSCKLSGTIINTMITECQSQKLGLEKLVIDNNDLNGVSLANLLKIAPEMKVLDMRCCKLSDTIVNAMVTECQSQKLGLELNKLEIIKIIVGSPFDNIKLKNDLSKASLAKFHQIFPKLKWIYY